MTEIAPKTWHHLALVRDRGNVCVYLDGKHEPELSGDVGLNSNRGTKVLLVGGRENGLASSEGMIDEVAVFDAH